MRRSLLIAILAIGCLSARAQFQGNVFVEDASVQVYAGGVQKQLAWCGGFNNPQFTMGDINHDGRQDMVVYESWGYNAPIRVFLNTGMAGNARYEYAPAFSAIFRDLSPIPVTDYLKLEDYNRDSIPDLITRGAGGFNIYRGRYVNDRLSFTYYKELRYNSPGGTINCYTQPTDIPAVADVDGDGDLDFFGYYEDGSILYFFKNCQVEENLPKDSIAVCKPTNCWGLFNQGYDRTFVLGILEGSGSCPTFFNYGCKGTLHQGNAICMLDMDGDGDMDMLDGNISFKDIQLVVNGRAQYGGRDSIVAQDTSWQRNGIRVDMPYWPAAFFVDADQDGKKDLLISPHAYGVSENYKCVAFYKNTGTTASPNFVYQNDTFMVDRMLDFGSASYPVLYDYDKDGRLDLFVGSSGYYQRSNGTFRSRIAYYKNVLSGSATRFELQTTDFMNISSEQVEGAYPAFGDLDNDGLDDMIVGHADGSISYYHNNTSSANVQPVWGAPVVLRDAQGTAINRTGYAAPAIYDITLDGKPDLLITGEIGSVSLYRNNSTVAGSLNLGFVTDTLGGMRSDATNYTYGTIYIGRTDNTTKPYIVIGNDKGVLRRYQGFETGNINIPYQLIDTIYSNLKLPSRSAAAFGDIDGDGKYELLAGNLLGGLQLFKQALNVNANVGVGTVRHTGVCSVYPNPASDVIYTNWDAAFAGKESVHVQLINMTGQTLLKAEYAGAKGLGVIPVAAYPAGMYLCVLQAGENTYTQRITIRK